jgi:hypothetical protein
LAISSILQGSLSTGDMAGLMADIITDIRVDGKLDNNALIKKLVNNAETLSSSSVRNNLISKYAELGISANIPNFENNVRSFINSKTDPSAVITYPESGEFGANILSDAVTTVTKMNANWEFPYYSMRADVPLGKSLRIVVNDNNRIGSSGSLNPWWLTYIWGEFDPNTWNNSLRDQNTFLHEFIVKHSGTSADLQVGFPAGKLFGAVDDYITIEYYENGSVTPTKVKRLYIVDP